MSTVFALYYSVPSLLSVLKVKCLLKDVYVDLCAVGVNSIAHNFACESLNMNMTCSSAISISQT